MDENKKEGYVTGLGCLVIFAIFLPTAISTGWNTSGQIFWAFTILFGGLGFGSLWKPDSVGAVTSQFLKNFAKNEERGSDSHNKQIQKETSGSVQVMGDEARVNVFNVAQESDAKGNTLWKPLPKINFSVAQMLPLRRLQFPQVGWEAYNDSPYQLRVRIEVHPILGGRDLHPLSDNSINGTYVYEVEPQTYVFANGCFTLPQVCAVSKDELILEIRATVEDINDPKKGEYKLVPRRWKYVRDHDAWSYYPQRPMTQ
jgi:hypothetical protein